MDEVGEYRDHSLEEHLYDLWLALTVGAPSKYYDVLFQRYSTAFEVFRADTEELEELGIPERIVKRMKDMDRTALDDYAEKCRKRRVGVIVRGGKGYPERLRSIRNAPYLLFFKGRLPDFDRKICTAVVGPRKMSEYGMNMAYKIGYELGAAGAVVVSGMARGIDACAAVGAMEAGGVTVAVTGRGLDGVYPPEHELLMKKICENGAVFSEYGLGEPPIASHFPQRNRIVSGLCQGTLVVEAGQRSGAMLTANDALVEGRQLYAVPGNVGSPTSAGSNDLIKAGATVVLRASDVIRNNTLLYGDTIDADRLRSAELTSDLRPGTLEKYGVFTVKSSATPGKTVPVSHAARQETDKKTGKNPEREPEEKSQTPKESAETGMQMTPETIPEGLLRDVYLAMEPGKRITADHLTQLGYSAGDAVTALSMLNVMGFVEDVHGGAYVRRS